MSHTPLTDETELLPWGEVTPAFWQQPGESSAVAVEPFDAGPGPEDGQVTTATDAGPLEGQDDDTVPEEYRSRIDAITKAVAAPHDIARLADADRDAERLDYELTERFGTGHSHTINLRELRGWLALVSGQPAVAARWYLHTTRLHWALRGPGHPATTSSAMRALHSWSEVKGNEEILELAPELEALLAEATGRDSDPTRFVRARAARRKAAAPQA